MKKTCESFVEEIAAFVSDAAELSADAAAHIRSCATCRKKIAELKAVAARHCQTAANMAQPNRGLTRTQLECALANDGSRWGRVQIRWRPVLAGAAALGLIVGAALMHRTPHKQVKVSQAAKHPQRATNLGPKAFEPTLLALHHQVEEGREQVVAASPGPGMRHYRLKDVEGELRN